jgi:hypothetical protein
MKRKTAELFDGSRGQRGSLISSTSKDIGHAQGRGENRSPDHVMPCAADFDAALKDADRERSPRCTAESEQSKVQCEGMIGRLSDPHCGLCVSDGLIEPVEIGEQNAEVGRRVRRHDGSRPKTLGSQVGLDQGSRRRRRAESAGPHEMAGHLVHNAAEALGHPPQPIVSLGGTDTCFWRRAGVPAFVYGCSPAGMGGIDESVRIAEFHHVLHVRALAAADYLAATK